MRDWHLYPSRAWHKAWHAETEIRQNESFEMMFNMRQEREIMCIHLESTPVKLVRCGRCFTALPFSGLSLKCEIKWA